MCSLPFLDFLLVLLPLQMVAFVAQRLEVRAVVESVGADWPGLYMVDARRRLDDAVLPAHLAQRMLGPECLRQRVPAPGVIRICRPLAGVSFALLNPVRMIPREPCHDSSFDNRDCDIRSFASCP